VLTGTDDAMSTGFGWVWSIAQAAAVSSSPTPWS
jgi:hypothetical protein